MSRELEKREQARILRKTSTPAERILWSRLRGRRLGNFKFRRQVPVGPFVADFACIQIKVIIEVDGDVHEQRAKQDAARTAFLTSIGWTILRFWNTEVYDEINKVENAIEVFCRHRASMAKTDL